MTSRDVVIGERQASPGAGVPSEAWPWLVADIGGTNARFGLITEAGARPSHVQVLACAGHRNLSELVAMYVSAIGIEIAQVSRACVAVAGPVTGDRARLTNSTLDFSIAQTKEDLSLDRLNVVNDFAALARALPHLGSGDLQLIGSTTPPRAALAKAVIGPGTGLGVGGVIPLPRGGWHVLAGEGGHAVLAPGTEEEAEVVRLARTAADPVTAETLLSGAGLSLMQQCLRQVRAQDVDTMTPAQICEQAKAEHGSLSRATVEMFCALLGVAAQSAALTLGARGGLFLGGGILPRIADILTESGFRSRFDSHPRMSAYLAPVATPLIIAPHPGLLGAAAWLEDSTM